MKRLNFILGLSFILCLITTSIFSQAPPDTIRVDGKYMGIIDKVEMRSNRNLNIYKVFVTLDEFPRNVDFYDLIKNQIYLRYDSGDKPSEISIEFKYRFENKTAAQIAGYNIRRAGELKNGRNNFILYGNLASMLLVYNGGITSNPHSIYGGFAIGLICNTIAWIKDYQSNNRLRKAGDWLELSK